MTDRFNGDGFRRDLIDGEEAAKHRHMFQEVNRSWVSLDGAVTVVKAITIIGSIIKVGGPVAVATLAAGAFAKTQGWL